LAAIRVSNFGGDFENRGDGKDWVRLARKEEAAGVEW